MESIPSLVTPYRGDVSGNYLIRVPPTPSRLGYTATQVWGQKRSGPEDSLLTITLSHHIGKAEQQFILFTTQMAGCITPTQTHQYLY
jgi:hypothetical protein